MTSRRHVALLSAAVAGFLFTTGPFLAHISDPFDRELQLQATAPFTWMACPGFTPLQNHDGDARHGDVCRSNDGRFQCPLGCNKIPQAPYCVLRSTGEPCRAAVSLEEWRAAVVPTRPVMHTFFAPTDLEQRGHGDMQRQLAVWHHHWQAAGWRTRVLTLQDAEGHRQYGVLREKFLQTPLGPTPEYEIACYLRHVAMAAVGGGWMSDFDTLPIGLPPSLGLPNNGTFTIHQRGPIPALISATAPEWDRMAILLARAAAAKQGSNIRLFTDMLAFQELARATTPPFMVDNQVVAGQLFLRDPENCALWQGQVAVHFSHRDVTRYNLSVSSRPMIMNITRNRWWQQCG